MGRINLPENGVVPLFNARYFFERRVGFSLVFIKVVVVQSTSMTDLTDDSGERTKVRTSLYRDGKMGY